MDGSRQFFYQLTEDLKITVRSMLSVYYETPEEERKVLEADLQNALDELGKIEEMYGEG